MSRGEEKLLGILFPKKRFKDEKQQKEHERLLRACEGYYEFFELVDLCRKYKIPYEEFKVAGNKVYEELQDSFYKREYIELLAQRVLMHLELNSPELIIINEYRRFFEKVVDLLGIEVTEEYRESVTKGIKDETD